VALWFKIHDDALDDPRLQRLAPATFRAWFNLLCVASRNGGRLPELSALAWLLRCGRKPLARRLDELKAVGLIEDVDGGLRPVEWERRQSLRDNTGDDPQTGVERTRRWRERRDAAVRPRDEDASPRDATVTGDQDQEQESQSAPAARASDSFEKFWQAFPTRQGDNPQTPARTAFHKAVAKGVDPAAIVAAAKAYAATVAGREARYIASAARWISEERWRGAAPAAPPGEAAGVWIKQGSPEWAAWTAHRGGKSPPTDSRGGWRFPSLRPLDAAPLAA
jgi:hypothetical protein